MMIIIHTTLGVIALISGAWNLIAEKGTQRHRFIGCLYAVSMFGLIGTSFSIFDLFGGFGPYHVMSLVSGGTLALALYFPIRRKRHTNWLEHHYMWITWSYVGLVMATGSHLFQYGPAGWSDWSLMLLFWGLPCLLGGSLIYGNKKRLLTQHSSNKMPQDTV